MRAVDHMLVRAEEMLKHAHYRLQCWIQTYHKRHFRPMAFIAFRPKTAVSTTYRRGNALFVMSFDYG
jgi:hypothetical protein